MGSISTLAFAWLRDFVTEGVASSGANKPAKADGRQVFSEIESRMTAVESLVSTDAHAIDAVDAATTAALPACTYANGTTGVGATLTGNSNGALADQDGITLTSGKRLLVKNQAAPAQNWVYSLTQVGDGSNPFILTRATDSDSADEIGGAYVFVNAGSTLIGTSWAAKLAASGITIGTTDLTPAKANGPGGVSAEAAARAAADVLTLQKIRSGLLDVVTDAYMISILQDIYIEGGDAGHQYVFNYETLDQTGGNGRVRFQIYDATLGIQICTWVMIDTQENFTARTSPTVFAYQSDLTGYTGITATIWINWANVTNWTKAFTTYTSAADGGIRTDRIVTRGEIMARFDYAAEPKIRLTVGAGTPSDTHFNTVLDAVQSLYIPDLPITRSTYPCSDICSFSNQVLIEVIDDAYSELVTLVTISMVGQSPILLPPFLTLRLRQDSRIYSDEATNSGPTIEAPFPHRIEGSGGGIIEADGAGGGYAVHIDNANDRAKRSTASGDQDVLRYPMITVLDGATVKCGSSELTWVYACSMQNGHKISVRRSRIICAAGKVGLGCHTAPSTTDPGEIEVTDSYFNDVAIGSGAIGISLLKGSSFTVQHVVNVKGCDVGGIEVGNTAGGDDGFIRAGKIDPAITITGSLSP